ncbi:MAG: SGNH/GDSL hydrolase family protein, partial [Ilumatobacteraceae bacterium]
TTAVVATPPPTEPPPEDTGPPTADNPAAVLIAGDSDAGTFAPYLDRLLADLQLTDTTLDYKVSSGLARPDFFDWQARLREQIPVVDPDIVVITFGGNDAQGLLDAGGGVVANQPMPDSDNAEWRAEYGKRVGDVMDFLAKDGRTVIWVGIPNDDNPDVTFRMQVQDETVKAEAAKRPAIVLIDTWKRFSGRTGGWAEYVIDPRDGVGKDVRSDDGFHLNATGAEILALDIAEAIKADLRARGAEV